jgi:hypothetical protein
LPLGNRKRIKLTKIKKTQKTISKLKLNKKPPKAVP